MLKFFRTIRHRLINKGPKRSYFWYAIGEITLVMIGILLAIQVNTWNENRKDGYYEQDVLNRLQKDLIRDMTQLERHDSLQTQLIQNYESVIDFLYKEPLEKEEIIELIDTETYRGQELILEQSTYDELKNTGKLYLIRNDSLRKSIAEYYQLIDLVSYYIRENNNDFIRMQFDPAFHPLTNIGSSNPEKGRNNQIDWSWLNNPAHETFQALQFMVANANELTEQKSWNFKLLITRNKALFQLIEAKLEDRK